MPVPESGTQLPEYTGVGTSGILWVQDAESKTRRTRWRTGEGISRFQ